jgi:hypothetical protein
MATAVRWRGLVPEADVVGGNTGSAPLGGPLKGTIVRGRGAVTAITADAVGGARGVGAITADAVGRARGMGAATADAGGVGSGTGFNEETEATVATVSSGELSLR